MASRSAWACAIVTPGFSRAIGLEAVTAALLSLGLGAVRVRRVLRDRDVEIERVSLDRKLKAGRHDTDHGVLASIQHDGAPEHIRVAAEMFLPEIMTDDDFEAAGLRRRPARHRE